MTSDELWDRLSYFFTNALGASRAIYVESLSPQNHAGRRTDNQLQLCSADFDADEAILTHRLRCRDGL